MLEATGAAGHRLAGHRILMTPLLGKAPGRIDLRMRAHGAFDDLVGRRKLNDRWKEHLAVDVA